MANKGYVIAEEGCHDCLTPWSTFTPTVTLVGGAGNTVPQYSSTSARYCQVGNQIFVEVNLSGDGGNEGAGSGQMNIALPTTAGASKVDGGMGSIIGQMVDTGADYIVSGIIDQGATTVKLYYFDTISSVATFTGAEQGNTSRAIKLSFTYEVD